MTAFQYAIPAGCLALLMSSTGALAQVTAQQVWDDWKGYLSVYGEDGVTIGSETYANGVLTVSDLAFSMTQEGMTVGGGMDLITLTEQADGSVLVAMPDTYPITVTGTDSDGMSIDLAMTLNQAGSTFNVSGAPGNMTYVVAVPRYELTVDHLMVDGEPGPLDMVVGANNVGGTYITSVTGDIRNIAYDLSIDSIDIKASAVEPGTSNSFTMSGTFNAITGQSTIAMPLDMTGIAPEDIMSSGFMIAADQAFGAAQMTINVSDSGTTLQAMVDMTGGTASVAMGGTAFDYGFAFQGMNLRASGDEMPFPVAFSADEVGMRVAVPMTAGDMPQDFAALLNLTGISLNDEIWTMFDPSGVIPRDPATFRVDMSGAVTLLVDLTSPDLESMDSAPGLLNSLSINDVTVSFGGADAHATGAFTFDNSDMTTFEGMPRPTGKLDIALNGVNGLIEKLVQVGLVPAEQVMGMSMMLGMFSVPVGDDQLTSTIEFTADGALLANGQRLQ